MNHPHSLGVSAESKAALERVDPKFLVEGLLKAREKTLAVVEAFHGVLREGLTEDEARKLALQVFAEHGVKKHWHKPNVRFGPGTALTFNEPLQPDYRLKASDPYYVDFGPVWADPMLGLEYEGDYGDTFVFGSNPEALRCAEAARALFAEARDEWKNGALSGEGIYDFLRVRSAETGYRLVENVEGHRIGDFPHHKYSKERLAKVPFVPEGALWVLEIQLNDAQDRFGAFFEDLIDLKGKK